MGVWSPAFQHQFLDGNLLNFKAAPGAEPTISFESQLLAMPSLRLMKAKRMPEPESGVLYVRGAPKEAP
jgi:hypothetical protein